MRILVYSNSSCLLDLLNLCTMEDMIEVKHIAYNRIDSMSLTSLDDVYIIDSDYVNEMDKAYLEVLKKLNVEVVLKVSELTELRNFMGFNIVEYFYGGVSFTKLSSCIVRLYEKRKKLKKLKERRMTDKFIVRNKSEAFVVDIKSIVYISQSDQIIHVCTDDRTYLCDDYLDRIFKVLPDQFFKVNEFVLVNFSKVKDIVKVSSNKYKLLFRQKDSHVYLTDYMLEDRSDDVIRNSRQKYVVETIMECIN